MVLSIAHLLLASSITILAPDISSVQPDLIVPPVQMANPAPGKRVKQAHPDYADTHVYHALYLPPGWRPNHRYPLIVEYAGNGPYRNRHGDISTGHLDHSRLGYGLTGGKGCIWLCLPYLNEAGTATVRQWWGDPRSHDPSPTVDYFKKTVPWICQRYGADPHRVVLCGFSRGAIACNYIGLHDDAIAQLWMASVPYSHYDGVIEWGHPGSDRASARHRLQRLGRRPQFILHENGDDARTNLTATQAYLNASGIDLSNITLLETGFRNHHDGWILRPSPARTALREWFSKAVTPTNG